jgi:aminopeptidase N
MRNKYSRELTWDWLVSNWDWVIENFGGSKSYDDFARYSAAFMNSEELLQKYKDFFEPKLDDISLKRTIQIGIKEIQARVDWRERDEQAIKDWLKKNS